MILVAGPRVARPHSQVQLQIDVRLPHPQQANESRPADRTMHSLVANILMLSGCSHNVPIDCGQGLGPINLFPE